MTMFFIIDCLTKGGQPGNSSSSTSIKQVNIGKDLDATPMDATTNSIYLPLSKNQKLSLDEETPMVSFSKGLLATSLNKKITTSCILDDISNCVINLDSEFCEVGLYLDIHFHHIYHNY